MTKRHILPLSTLLRKDSQPNQTIGLAGPMSCMGNRAAIQSLWRSNRSYILIILFGYLFSIYFFSMYAPAFGYPDLYEASIIELQTGLELGRFTSVDLTTAYLARIKEVNTHGPMLRAVIETNPHALEQAAALDTERRLVGPHSPLHGIPVLVKDNIGTSASEGMNTTAGSYALLGSTVSGDATVVRKLREAGAIILGKSNMCEWAHERGNLADGWSGRGGQTTNPYYPGATTFGSSSGSAVGIAIGLAAGALGTETDSSIIGPASANNVVGIKPTVGLTSRAGIIPVSPRRDSVGPIARSVTDAAIILTIIAGRDSADNYTHNAPAPAIDYMISLRADSLQGKRFGVPKLKLPGDITYANDTSTRTEFERALETVRNLGGTIVDTVHMPDTDVLTSVCKGYWGQVLKTDLKLGLNAYLKDLKNVPTNVTDIRALIAFNDANKRLEEPKGYEDQSRLLDSASTTGHDEAYWNALNTEYRLGRDQGIDAALEAYNLDALIFPSQGRLGNCLASIAGYPTITVPLGFHHENTPVIPKSAGPHTVYPAPGLPFGISFVGKAFSEPELIGFAYAYEQHTHARLKRRAYRGAIPGTQLKNVLGGGRDIQI